MTTKTIPSPLDTGRLKTMQKRAKNKKPLAALSARKGRA
jgi:hypothetical protein